jgi:hypothetical protein
MVASSSIGDIDDPTFMMLSTRLWQGSFSSDVFLARLLKPEGTQGVANPDKDLEIPQLRREGFDNFKDFADLSKQDDVYAQPRSVNFVAIDSAWAARGLLFQARIANRHY